MYAMLILVATIVTAQAPGAPDCIPYPSVTENFRVIVPPSDDPMSRGGRAIVLASSPGWERNLSSRYHFWAERAGGSPVELTIEGPVSRDAAERRFGTISLRGIHTFWVLPVPVADEQGDRVITVRYKESGYRPTTNEACALDIRIPLVTIARKVGIAG